MNYEIREGLDEIDLMQLLDTLWKGRLWVLGFTAISAAIAIAVTMRLSNQYVATATLMSASTSNTSSLSRLAGQFGGLASLAGISLSGQGDGDKTTAAIELIKSWGFEEQFIRDRHLEVPVFGANGWDRSTNQLSIDSSLYDVTINKWVREYNSKDGQSAPPGGWELYEKFSKRVSISQDKKTGLVTLSVEYYSPFMAKDWVDQLVIAVNKHMQEIDQAEAEKSIQYLEQKLNQTGLTEMKTVFSRLIEEQTKNLMLAQISDEYVLRTLSPAKVPEKKSGPNRLLICTIAAVGGACVSALSWLLWSAFKARRFGVHS